MVNSGAQSKGMNRNHCSDPLIGDILAGWRYDISGLSAIMRKDYDQHLAECGHCRRRQRLARTIDILLISVSALSIVTFLLAAAVLHRIEAVAHLGNTLHAHLYHTPITISLEAAAVAGVVVSVLLCVLVAISTPIPGIVGEILMAHIPQSIRGRINPHA